MDTEKFKPIPLNKIEQLLKQLFKQYPEYHSHILNAEELTDYLSFLMNNYKDLEKTLDLSEFNRYAILPQNFATQQELHHFRNNEDISFSQNFRYMPAHWHTNDYFEIYYSPHEGAQIYFPEETLILQAGTVVIIAPGTTHATPCYKDNQVLYSFSVRRSTFEKVFFDQLPADSLMANFFRQVLNNEKAVSYLLFDTQEDTDIYHLLLQIQQEYLAKETYKSQMLNALTSTFFILLLRRYESTVSFPSSESLFWKQEYSGILSYIQTHYDTTSLEELSCMYHYSEKQISRIVKSCTGVSFHDLILELKMEKAKNLLQNNYPISDIASVCGYSGLSSFYRAYSKYYGTTPRSSQEDISS